MNEINIIYQSTNNSNMKLEIEKSVFYKDKKDMKIGKEEN